MARVKTQLRWSALLGDVMAKFKPSEGNPPQEVLVFKNLEINLIRREVLLDGQVVELKPQVYDLFLFFAQHKSQKFSHEFILERVWGSGYFGERCTVGVHARWLRQKIEKDVAEPIRIVTVRGGGYRFEG